MRSLLFPALLSALLAAAPGVRAGGDPALGERAFAKCKACHGLEAGTRHRIGPNLHGLFGRTSGTAAGYKYSEAMRQAAVVWDAANLAAYLHDPKGFMPGNKMIFAGLRQEKELADLIAYLEAATR